jgi:protein-L-isoaspartate O-methyltransferase
MLEGRYRDLPALAGGGAVLDIGCADGFKAFFLESVGMRVHAVDHSPLITTACAASASSKRR